jgi:hypothetical protein
MASSCAQGSRVLPPPTRRGQVFARLELTSGRLEHTSSASAGSDREPSSRGRWYAVPPNMALQLTSRFVTPFAYAKVAPNRLAAEL